jgi:predicted RNase H-like nuclease
MLVEFFLGDPVEKEINGKILHVEFKGDHTEVKYGDKSLILSKETMIEAIAVAVEWAMKELKDETPAVKGKSDSLDDYAADLAQKICAALNSGEFRCEPPLTTEEINALLIDRYPQGTL